MNIEHVRQRLLARRDELRAREARANAGLRDQPDLSSADEGDVSNQSERNGLLTALSRAADTELKQVENALTRIREGNYETCAVCGEPIEQERLEAVPHTNRCIHCAAVGSNA